MNILQFFNFCTCSRDMIDMFSDKRTLMLAFWQTFKGGLSNFVHDHNLAQGLAIHTRFDDFDFISRSQVCQNHKQQIIVKFLLPVV